MGIESTMSPESPEVNPDLLELSLSLREAMKNPYRLMDVIAWAEENGKITLVEASEDENGVETRKYAPTQSDIELVTRGGDETSKIDVNNPEGYLTVKVKKEDNSELPKWALIVVYDDDGNHVTTVEGSFGYSGDGNQSDFSFRERPQNHSYSLTSFGDSMGTATKENTAPFNTADHVFKRSWLVG